MSKYKDRKNARNTAGLVAGTRRLANNAEASEYDDSLNMDDSKAQIKFGWNAKGRRGDALDSQEDEEDLY